MFLIWNYNLNKVKFNDYDGEAPKGLWSNLMSTHTSIDNRISKLQELGVKYRKSFLQ